MDFPHWHQPDKSVGAVFVTSQAELDALNAAGWPHGKPEMTTAEIIAALEAKGAKVDKRKSKAALAEPLAAL